MEQWRDIAGFVGQYQVSDLGRIKSLPSKTRSKESIIYTFIDKHTGYSRVNLRKGGESVTKNIHRLVLTAFRGECPPGMEGCHENGIRSDCRLNNLRWDTPKANQADKKVHGTSNDGFRNPQAKMTEAMILEIRLLLAAGKKSVDIAKKFGVHPNTIYNIKSKRIWSDIV